MSSTGATGPSCFLLPKHHSQEPPLRARINGAARPRTPLLRGASDPTGEIGLGLLFVGLVAAMLLRRLQWLGFESRSKLSDCAFSLVDLPKGVSAADVLQQRRRFYPVCPVGQPPSRQFSGVIFSDTDPGSVPHHQGRYVVILVSSGEVAAGPGYFRSLSVRRACSRSLLTLPM
jgi:hypothetical protein